MTLLLSVAMLAPQFHLHDGDRVVFYGDSITEQRLYTTYVEAFVLTRYPGLDVKFVNRGWAGDTSWGGGGGTTADRVKNDVATVKPTVVTVMLGMNDGGYVPPDDKIATVIKTHFHTLVDHLKTALPDARLTVMSTSPWDDWAHDYSSSGKPPEPWAPWKGYNDVLLRYQSVYRDEARNSGAQFIDLNTPLVEILQKAVKIDKTSAAQFLPDSIHPGPAGHLMICGQLVQAWGAEPVVSQVAVDVANKSISARGAHVQGLSDWTWTQTDEALPFPTDNADPVVRLAAALSSFDARLNRQILQVSGLGSGSFDLTIDGHVVARLTSAQFEQGVNLVEYDTPMRKQAQEVLALVKRAADLDFVNWRTVERENGDVPASRSAVQALRSMVDQLHDRARKRAQPVPHRFSIARHRTK